MPMERCPHAGCSIHTHLDVPLHPWLSLSEKEQIWDDLQDGWSIHFVAKFYDLDFSVVQKISFRGRRGLPLHPKGIP